MSSDMNKSKSEMRAYLKQQLQGLSEDELRVKSDNACEHLTNSACFKAADIVMIYLPIRREVDITKIALRGWQMGKLICVPLVSWEHKHMIPVQIKSLDDPMKQVRHGVREPANGIPLPIEDIDLVVVPGLGFDQSGRRIGRGGGFYDRFLSQRNFKGISCGIGFSDQIVEEVPVSDNDVWLKMLVTDAGVNYFGSNLG